MSVVNFNHIAQLPEDEIAKLKRWYMCYHKLYICYKWKYKKIKRIRLSLNMSSVSLIVIGGIAGGVTANPIILGVISGPGVLIHSYITKSNINSKVEMCKFAYTSYKKILTQLRSYLRGLPYDETVFLSDVKVIDDIIIDLCPPVNGMSGKYDKIYGSVYEQREN